MHLERFGVLVALERGAPKKVGLHVPFASPCLNETWIGDNIILHNLEQFAVCSSLYRCWANSKFGEIQFTSSSCAQANTANWAFDLITGNFTHNIYPTNAGQTCQEVTTKLRPVKNTTLWEFAKPCEDRLVTKVHRDWDIELFLFLCEYSQMKKVAEKILLRINNMTRFFFTENKC